MPKLWSETIEAHRREVRDAILDATAALMAEHGLRSVTMLQIAQATGIGRATLYKYFSGVDAVLIAWHDREITRHLEQLAAVRARGGGAAQQLAAVLETYALIAHASHGHHDSDLAAFLHRNQRVARAQEQVRDLLRDLLTKAAKTGDVRDDIPPQELANFCFHALAAASGLSSHAAVSRLVTVILAGLRPPA